MADNLLNQAVLAALTGQQSPTAVRAGMTGRVPQLDLGRVNVNTTPPGVQSQVSKPESSGKFVEFLKRMGIPLASAIAGSVNPNLLPQAAGLSKGYVDTQMAQDKREADYQEEIDRIKTKQELEESKEHEAYLIDKVTGERIGQPIKFKKGDKVLLGGEEYNMEDIFGGAKKVKEEKSRIRVKNKETGETGTIPESEFDKKLYERL